MITTSRRQLDTLDDCGAIRLEPLAVAESAALLAAITERSGETSDPELARFAAVSGGIPRAVRIAAAQLRQSEPPRSPLSTGCAAIPPPLAGGWPESSPATSAAPSMSGSMQTIPT
jgi:hypothetical protein